MTVSKEYLWRRFKEYYTEFPSIGLALDLSRVNFSDDFFARTKPLTERAFAEMEALEKGAIANKDENRMVGHYWLRNTELSPSTEIRNEIDETLSTIKAFAADVRDGRIRGEKGVFKNVLLIGIGGSALGPQFVSNALGHPIKNERELYFFDNTDPDGMDKIVAGIINELGETLCIVISKSGGTKETRNGMLEAKLAYERTGLDFGHHAVAVTQKGSELDAYAIRHKWIQRFPMWDWVGGRTSEMSAVGLLPAALQGFDIDCILAGAKACDNLTRANNVKENPSMALAMAWFCLGNGKGEKDMVIVPYKDRLDLLSKYLQQLIMESLGKELDRDGKVVNQGISVYGNKGSTDQHAYIQQLREGVHNFFVTFVEVLKDRDGLSPDVEDGKGITSGDYLHGFFLGTREALYENGRQSITLTLNEISAFSVGVLIALFERAVGFYASMINVNAYHQPGVQAGKKAADAVIVLQGNVVNWLRTNSGTAYSAEEIANAIRTDDCGTVFKICEHLAANSDRGIKRFQGKSAFDTTFQVA